MTPREKKLAAITAVLLVVLGGYFLWSQVSASLSSRRRSIANLRTAIADQQFEIEKGRRAKRRLEAYQHRSLPSDREVARSIYQDWLLDLVEQEKLDDANVNALTEYPHQDVFHRLTFSISGVGRLDQITRLLYRFYQFDHLHAVRRLQIRPIKDSRNLELSMSVEAAVLPGSSNTIQLTTAPNPLLQGETVKTFFDEIVGRNIFAPPNHPPELRGVGSQRIELGSSLSFTAEAKDPDKLDTVRYQLGDDAPAGATISFDSGKFSWRPSETGRYQFGVIALDDGMPQRETRQTVRVTVVDPPPKVVAKPVERPRKLDFDVAKHTYLIGTIESSGQREIWLQNRTSGKIHKLRTGDSVRFGSVDGTVARIGDRDAEISIGDKRLLLAVGKNLAEAQELNLGGI